jgi:predicted AAA+ superfamily ATPase
LGRAQQEFQIWHCRSSIVFIDNENFSWYHFIMNENYWPSKWSNEQIKAILLEQFATFWQRDTGVRRQQLAAVEQAAAAPHAVIISGLRRVGKSTLLAQLAHGLGEDQFYYVNFEDERFLGFQAQDANHLYERLIETFGVRTIFIVDEIQNIEGWEHFVRRFMEMGAKFYITGSNASLLSRELGNRLTGRYIPIELFPFSFQEFVRFRQYPAVDLTHLTTVDFGLLQHYLGEYLHRGGIPEPLQYPNLPLLRTLYDDVIYRDIATRYRIEDVRALKELAYYLTSNPASLISFNKLKEQFRLGSVNTIKNYVEFLENSWLIFCINAYDYSVKRQQIAPKKVYSIDTGLVREVGFSFSPDSGKLLENVVFLALRRRETEVYYAPSASGFEVDFYLPKRQALIQVSQHLAHPGTRERETRALFDAMRTYGMTSGLILTEANEPSIIENGLTIEIRSVAEWLLAQE